MYMMTDKKAHIFTGPKPCRTEKKTTTERMKIENEIFTTHTHSNMSKIFKIRINFV